MVKPTRILLSDDLYALEEEGDVSGFKCGGIIGPETTREELRQRGISEEGIDELEDYRTYLEAKERGILDCDYETWRDRGR